MTPAGAPPPRSPRGIRIRRVEGAPVVAVRIWIPGGSRVETIPGQALISGRLLAEGTSRRDWQRISLEAEARGCALVTAAGQSVQAVAIDGLAGDWRQVLDWAVELAWEAGFPEDRCDWLCQQALAELESLADLPEVVTGWAFLDQLYPGHPLGRPLQGTKAGLSSLSGEACAGFHRSCQERGALIAVAGEIDEDRVAAHLQNLLHGRDAVPARTAELAEPPEPAEARRRVALPPGDQAHLFLGGPTVRRRDGDFEAVRLLGVVLGAGSGLAGRIPERIRENEGLSYTCDVDTIAGAGIDRGRLVVSLGTAAADGRRAATAVREELERVWRDGVSEAEVELARSYLIGREPFGRETARQLAVLDLEAMLWDLPVDDPEWLREQLEATTVEEVGWAARRYLDPARMIETLGIPA